MRPRDQALRGRQRHALDIRHGAQAGLVDEDRDVPEPGRDHVGPADAVHAAPNLPRPRLRSTETARMWRSSLIPPCAATRSGRPSAFRSPIATDCGDFSVLNLAGANDGGEPEGPPRARSWRGRASPRLRGASPLAPRSSANHEADLAATREHDTEPRPLRDDTAPSDPRVDTPDLSDAAISSADRSL